MRPRPPADPRTFARLAYTTLFDHVVPTSVVIPTLYGKLYAINGAAAPLRFILPASSFLTKANGQKDTYHVGFINCDGANQVNIGTSDGKLINFSGSDVIITAGEPGGFAICFWANDAGVGGGWVAMLGCCVPPT